MPPTNMLRLAKTVVGEGSDDVAVFYAVAVSVGDDAFQFVFQLLQAGDLFADVGKVLAGDLVGIAAGPFRMLAEGDQPADRLDRQAEIAAVADKGQPLHIGLAVAPLVAVAARMHPRLHDTLTHGVSVAKLSKMAH